MNLSLSINSALSLAAAFLLMHFFNEYSTALAASCFGLKPVMYMHSIKYAAYDLWTPYSVKRTFIVSGIMNLVLGFLFFRFFILVRKRNKWYRTFFLWCSVTGVVMFLGKIISIPFYQFKPDPAGHISFGMLAAYEYMGEPFKWVIAVLGVLLTVVAGLFFTYQFLRIAESKEQLRKSETRRDFIFTHFMAPYITGMFVVAAANFPNNLSSLLMYFFVGFVLVISSILFSARTVKVLLYREEAQSVSYFAMGMLTVLIVFYQSFYQWGIGCKGYFDVLFCNC